MALQKFINGQLAFVSQVNQLQATHPQACGGVDGSWGRNVEFQRFLK